MEVGGGTSASGWGSLRPVRRPPLGRRYRARRAYKHRADQPVMIWTDEWITRSVPTGG
jgi:hypothetical protein